MSTKKVLMIVLVASAVMLAVGIGPRSAYTAQALLPAQEPNPPGVTIPYPGRLTDAAGQPVADGTYAFTFALYEAPTGGEPLWSEVQEGVAVERGAFVAALGSVNPIPATLLDGSAELTASGGERWLEVAVRGPGETAFTALTPRQELSLSTPASPASPNAPPSCPHDHLYANWIGSNAGYTFRVENQTTGDGIRGISYATAPDFAGVVGACYGAGGSGVYGLSTTSGDGVYGRSATGDGVAGITGGAAPKAGVYGEDGGSSPDDAWAVFARGDMYTDDDLVVSGNLTVYGSKSGYVVEIAQNDDTVSLAVGDVVVISGAGPAVGGEIPVVRVRLAREGKRALWSVWWTSTSFQPRPAWGWPPTRERWPRA